VDQTQLAEQRNRFAAAMASAPGVDDPRVGQAFARVPRENFVGRGPWMVLSSDGYIDTPSADPALLYQDIVVALAPEKRINNGQPSLHARCLSAAHVRPGEQVLHIGCGSGYYTAILAELATHTGVVTAWDVEPTLVAAASHNLRRWSNVAVALRSGTSPPISPSDVIYVNAGCTRPLKIWVDALQEGGRLLFPLTPGWNFGGMLKVTRRGNGYEAQFICRCSFIPCNGNSDAEMEDRLAQAFSRGGIEQVLSLHFGVDAPGTDLWFAGEDWWLSTAPATQDVAHATGRIAP
jgi:protein-L-isoaspartate(D-aspartate) O-methyltransferase